MFRFLRYTQRLLFHICLPCLVRHTAVLLLLCDLTWFTVTWLCVEKSAPKTGSESGPNAAHFDALDPGATQQMLPTQPMPWRQRDGRTPIQDTSEPRNTMDKNLSEDPNDPGPTQSMRRVVTLLEKQQLELSKTCKRQLDPAFLQTMSDEIFPKNPEHAESKLPGTPEIPLRIPSRLICQTLLRTWALWKSPPARIWRSRMWMSCQGHRST